MGSTCLPSIETERLWLREIEESDLDEWAQLTYGDPEMMVYLPVRDSSGRERARRASEFHAKPGQKTASAAGW